MTLTRKEFAPALLIASNGDLWYWNCGWFRKKGGQRRPMGHSAFRKAVSILQHDDDTAKTTLMGVDKPQRQWRRMTGNCEFMTHELYGTVQVLATDGCHARVLSDELGKKTVSFDALTEMPSKGTFTSGKKVKPLPKMNSIVTNDDGLEMVVREIHDNRKTFKCEYTIEDDENPELNLIVFKWFHKDNLTVKKRAPKSKSKGAKKTQSSQTVVNKYLAMLD